jgi:cellulose synthase (UDP-forming)
MVQRLMFLPTHWISQALTQVATLTAPCIYLLTGLLPMLNVTPEAVVFYQIPVILGAISALRFFAPAQYFPLAATVLGVLQSFRFLPVLIGTLFRPHGHAFRVTPKGNAAAGRSYDRFTVALAGIILTATALGFILNSDLDSRIIDDVSLVPVVALWCGFNSVVLLIVLVTAFAAPTQRNEDRFALDEPILLRVGENTMTGRIRDLSLSGMSASVDGTKPLRLGDWLSVTIGSVGEIPARVVRAANGELGLAFHLPLAPTRDRMIRKIFTGGHDNTTRNDDALAISLQMIGAIFRDQPAPAPIRTHPVPDAPPARLISEIAARADDVLAWDADTLAELWQTNSALGGGKAA